ncbi:zinc ribbon domain-containing protein [candidate division KSB1 bacterium]|nr:zinc ribbon domain-containing protein [candidate division KSB1 bacterium]
MNKKKLIRKMAIPAAVIFIISIVVLLLFEGPVEQRLYKEHVAELNAHLAELTEKSQADLAEIAGKIAAIETGEIGESRVVAELQSEFLRDNQNIDQAKKYLWMSNQRGEFIFGVPVQVFAKLNAGFDKNSDIINRDGHYKDRNDFLMKLVDKHDNIDFSDRALPEQEGYYPGRNEGMIEWRFYKESKEDWQYSRPRTLILSAPVANAAGAVAGSLFLKIDDFANRKLYYSRNYATNSHIYQELFTPLFAILAVLSGIFLWFLLPSWVYIDAQQRGVSNPGVWAFISLISLVFGLAIYLITRPATMKSLHCPKCENQLNGAGAFCPHCGFDLSSTYCPQCQYPIKPEWSFCPNCRAEIKQRKSPEAPPELAKSLEALPEKE